MWDLEQKVDRILDNQKEEKLERQLVFKSLESRLFEIENFIKNVPKNAEDRFKTLEENKTSTKVSLIFIYVLIFILFLLFFSVC
jgi:hypothetical protein